MVHANPSANTDTTASTGASKRERHRRRQERDLVGDGAHRPYPVGAAQQSLVGALAPAHVGQLGQLARGRQAHRVGRPSQAHRARRLAHGRRLDQPPAIGRRRTTSSASSGSSRTAVAVPSGSEATAR